MSKSVYKAIQAFVIDEFNDLLNKHIEDGWMVHDSMNATLSKSGCRFSILLLKNVMVEEQKIKVEAPTIEIK